MVVVILLCSGFRETQQFSVPWLLQYVKRREQDATKKIVEPRYYNEALGTMEQLRGAIC